MRTSLDRRVRQLHLDIGEDEPYRGRMGRNERQIHMGMGEEDQTLNLQTEPAVVTASKQLTEISNRPNPNFVSRARRPYPTGDTDAPPRGQPGSTEPKCFTCGEPGHFQRECPERETTRPHNLRCYFCDEPGHIQRECRARAQYLEQQRKKNLWTKERASRETSPPPVQPGMPNLRRKSPAQDQDHPEERTQWPTTGRHRTINNSSGFRNRQRQGAFQAQTSGPKNWQTRGQRAPMTPTLPRQYSKQRKPLVSWQE
jgi:hypothetical protein